MPVDFGTLSRNSATGPVHPRDIFGALPNKPSGMEYLRGPQDQVLEKWWNRRDERDLVVKMNTGGGKTVVGLLIAQSAIVEDAGPAAYLVPDHFLVEQVVAEAQKLGLEVTTDAKDHRYARGRAILIDVFQRLFNGRSVFGVDGSAGKRPSTQRPGTIIIDDAHACLLKAEQASQLVIPSSHQAYQTLLELFGDSIQQQSPAGYRDLVEGHRRAIQQVPFWAWADNQRKVLEALHPLADEDGHMFAWPLLVDVLTDCRAVFTADQLEIAPPCLNCDALQGFRLAGRRVYLTATLADDGVLVTDFGANAEQVAKPITPANAGDIGDRLILVPQQTHPNVSEEQVRSLVRELASERNVAVIVPSSERALFWTQDTDRILDKTNLTAGVAAMRSNPKAGLFVLVNRYDGVDLPGDTCHVLVIDGLPEVLGALERVDAAQLSGSDLLVARQVQRLEQGMGRATRSNDDHCVVFLLGARLAERLHGPGARQSFSPATRAQIELSEEVGDLMDGSDLATLRDVAEQCLARDTGWVTASRNRLATLRYEPAVVTSVATGSRAGFEAAVRRDYAGAIAELQVPINETSDSILKGYLKQQLAAYKHHIDPAAAQQAQKSANSENHNLLRPMEGVRYEKLKAPTYAQAAAASSYLQQHYSSSNDLVIRMNALLGDINWGVNAKQFEQAWADLAKHLGFAGQRPEHETGRGPDVLWAVGGDTFLVCEAKNQALDTHPVYKDDAKQLSNAMDWFEGEYTTIGKGVPLLIHPRATFDRKAAVPAGCRVITVGKMGDFRDALQNLIVELAAGDAFRDPERIGKLLTAHDLTAEQILTRYTVAGVAGA